MPGRIAVKTITALTLAIVLVAGLMMPAPTSYAQSTNASGQRTTSVLDRIRKKMQERQTPEDRARRWFDNLDKNNDEEITKKELFESVRRRFDAMDGNRDRHVSKAEYLRLRKDRQNGERRFGELDANSDGRLSVPEFASPADWRFDRIDRNLDGKVSRQEAARLFDPPGRRSAARRNGRMFLRRPPDRPRQRRSRGGIQEARVSESRLPLATGQHRTGKNQEVLTAIHARRFPPARINQPAIIT